MTSEPETPRITELHVRMDCNGCVHKMRKTLTGIDGVGEVHVDQANHKITVVGIADPARIVKAIRKANRHIVVATVLLAYQSTAMWALQPKKEDATTIQRLLGEEEMGARSLRCSARRTPTHAA
ncbi:hypothetical protein TRIUR3_07365 [Triticum urartu]|uniref:HMA domain-containing protein n=1 Tax=Triticum urartu TaxID=4572 RepID=M7YIT5_TRIUA|nr:hypothetical protein TRIUR3_07365 [Triticum urartu]